MMESIFATLDCSNDDRLDHQSLSEAFLSMIGNCVNFLVTYRFSYLQVGLFWCRFLKCVCLTLRK